MAEEEILDTLTKKRLYLEKHIGELSDFTKKFIQDSSQAKDVSDDEKVSLFTYYLANEPSTRQEAHWQLQSYVLLEILQVLKEIQGTCSICGAGPCQGSKPAQQEEPVRRQPAKKKE